MKNQSHRMAVGWTVVGLLFTLGCQNNEHFTVSGPTVDKSEAVCYLEIETIDSSYSSVVPEWIPTREFRELQLALARILVSEAGFQLRTLDGLLIYETLRHRSMTGEVTMDMMRRYSTRTFDRNRTDSRRWIPYLNPEGTRPRGWTDEITIPWSARRADWLRVYQYAGYLLRHPQRFPCTMRVHHWGSRGFRYWRHIHAGWIPVNCGEETANTFWHVPSRNNPHRNACFAAERICR
jgi:hypothetical protein